MMESCMARVMMAVMTAGMLCCLPQATHGEGERQATGPESIRAAAGFEVERLRSAAEGEDSWISLSIDSAGVIYLGLDTAAAARLTTSDGTTWDFERIDNTDDLRHCRGILKTDTALYLVATDSQQLVRLVDGDGDGVFEHRTTLADLPYASRYGHGMNQLVQGPEGKLFLIVGNDVELPATPSPRSTYRDPREDWLLPSPHDLGQDDRVGAVIRFDPSTSGADDGSWEVIAGGFRNPFDLAFNRDGECFTWDADMEWDAGLPWYRPTRLNHVVAGGEYGWRWGSGKWPVFFADSLPSTLDTGFASPTGMLFGDATNWPSRYRDALFMADWQHGRMLLVDLVPEGASYTATAEVFLEGSPLNICDMAIGPDQAMYFTTGGRGSQSGLYRVRWTGESTPPLPVIRDPAVVAAAAGARGVRHTLEQMQREPQHADMPLLIEQLASPDRWLRSAARAALERQPIASWMSLPAELSDPQARRTAALALARVGPAASAETVLAACLHDDWQTLSPAALAETLRTVELSIIRQGLPATDRREQLLTRLDMIDPEGSFAIGWLSGELLVRLESNHAVSWLLRALAAAATQEEQLQYAKTLSRIETGWSVKTARQVVAWLNSSLGMPGGRLVETAWRNLRSDFSAVWPEELRAALASELAELDRDWSDERVNAGPSRPFVRDWTVDALLDAVAQPAANDASHDASPDELTAGMRVLAEAGCLSCHRYGDRGTHTGPELTAVGRRLNTRGLLESIVEPSRQIDPKYALATLLLDDGTVITGRAVGVNSRELTVEVDPLKATTVVVDRSRIEQSLPTARSPMPEGLLDSFTADEIASLLTLLTTSPAQTAP